MKAARIHAHGGPEMFRVEEVPDPVIGPNDVLVRQFGTSLNHRDVWLRKGLPGETFQIPLPHILGIDVAGEVVEVGSEVRSLRRGDRIVSNPFIACGRCRACLRLRPEVCASIDIANGAYAELVAVPEARAMKIADSVPVASAACFANTYITAWEMLVRKARITPDDTVFIWAGTSGLGSAAIDIASIIGCDIITTAGSDAKIEFLRGGRASLVINHHHDDVVARVAEYTHGEGASVVFEHVGSATIGRTVDLAASGARIVSCGLTSGRMLELDVVTMIMKQFSMTGSCLGTMASARAAVAQLNRGRLSPLIGRRMPLDSIVEAHEFLESGQAIGKIMIEFN